MFGVDALDGVTVGQVHLDRVAGGRDRVGLEHDRVEERRKTVPLGGELVVSRGARDGVAERGLLGPEG